ncbi:hypothetical protein [Halostella pelagica]|uniref:hypothetical protein n=1 Tax=Halostella pelagica TaxID=2583824 RepID=UPI0010818A58|nr:hypothetical protein [Halostella pelagica]
MVSEDARRVAVAELRRTCRRAFENDRRLLLFAATTVLAAPFWYVGGTYVYRFGERIGRGSVAVPIEEFVAGQLSLLAVFTLGITFLRAVYSTGYPDASDAVLVATSAGDVAVGLVLAECIRILVAVGLPVFVFITLFASGTRDLLLVVTGCVTVGLLVTACVTCGYLCGLVAMPSLRGLSRNARWVLGGTVLLSGVVILSGYEGGNWFGAEFAAARFPINGYVDLFLLGADQGSATSRQVAVAAATAVAFPVAVVAALRRTVSAVWFTTAPDCSEPTADRSRTRHAPFGWSQPSRVAWLQIVRAARNPHRLVHVLYSGLVILPGFLPAGGGRTEFLRTVLLLLPPTAVVYCAWLSGALFCLNPIGDEGPMYSQLLIAPVSGREIIRGRILAGLCVSVSPTVVVVAALGVVGPISAGQTLTLVLYGVVLSVCASAVASGLGCLVPATEPTAVSDTREVILPNLVVLGLYSFVVGVVGLVGLLLLFVPSAFRIAVPTYSAEQIQLVGGVGTATVGGAVAVSAYLYAAARFDRYTLS